MPLSDVPPHTQFNGGGNIDMKRLVLILGMLAALGTGCTANDASVSSVSSAVESEPAPPPDTDMQRINTYCHTSCLIRVGQCYDDCYRSTSSGSAETSCDAGCEDGREACHAMCERMFPW